MDHPGGGFTTPWAAMLGAHHQMSAGSEHPGFSSHHHHHPSQMASHHHHNHHHHPMDLHVPQGFPYYR